jgi:FAD synthetase
VRVLVFGTFDRLHPGHEFVLNEGLSRGELHVVVARDVTVQRIKGRAPEQSEVERLHAIQNFFPVSHAVLGDSQNYLKPVLAIAPDLILLGYDQQLPPNVRLEDLPCPIERLSAFKPKEHKSSIRRGAGRQ